MSSRTTSASSVLGQARRAGDIGEEQGDELALLLRRSSGVSDGHRNAGRRRSPPRRRGCSSDRRPRRQSTRRCYARPRAAQAVAVTTNGAVGSRLRHFSRSSVNASRRRVAAAVVPGGPHAEREGLPPLLEALVLEARGQGRSIRRREGSAASISSARWPSRVPAKPRFIIDLRVELAGRLPEHPERAHAAAVIPHAGGDDTTRPGHARHLRQPGHRIRHEVHDELGKGGIEPAVREGQLLGGCRLHVDARVARPSGRNERLGRVNGRYGRWPQPADELGGEGAGTAADVDHPLPGAHPREVRQLRRELRGSTGP